MDIVETSAFDRDGLIIIDTKGAVWFVLDLPWWDPISWFRRLTLPGKRAWLLLSTNNGKVRVRAVRISSTYVRIGQ